MADGMDAHAGGRAGSESEAIWSGDRSAFGGVSALVRPRLIGSMQRAPDGCTASPVVLP